MGARIPPDDDELLLIEHLDLQPILRSPPFVARRFLLRDDPFVAAILRELERLLARQRELLRDAHAGGRAAEGFLERRAPLLVGLLAKIPAVEPEDVEEENQLALLALLQQLEARRSLIVERDDLAVQDHFRQLDFAHGVGNDRKTRDEIELVAAPHRDAAVDDCYDRAEAVV